MGGPTTPLGERVRRRLDSGLLPRKHPGKVWGGFGDGHQCCVCDEKLYPAQVMYQVELNYPADLKNPTFSFHAGCYGVWVGELIRQDLYRPH